MIFGGKDQVGLRRVGGTALRGTGRFFLCDMVRGRGRLFFTSDAKLVSFPGRDSAENRQPYEYTALCAKFVCGSNIPLAVRTLPDD